MADALTLLVPEELDGARLDKALAVLLQIGRNEAKSLIELGVTVDGRDARGKDTVNRGNVISSPSPVERRALQAEDVVFDVLLETPDYVVVNKPAGVVVHPGAGRTRGTLAAGLLSRYPDLEGVGQADRWGLVHRLDKETSGVLLVARTGHAYRALSADIKARSVERRYVALVSGVFGIPTGTIEAPIGRDPTRPTRRAVIETGKAAVTHYEVVETMESADCSLVRIRLETGRTHQIRVHFAEIRHPVIGDRTYASGPATVTSPRIFLHAERIEFADPQTGVRVSAEAPLPPDLSEVLSTARRFGTE